MREKLEFIGIGMLFITVIFSISVSLKLKEEKELLITNLKEKIQVCEAKNLTQSPTNK